MSEIKVSIIIPVYNVEKYLHKCLDSVINQTLKEIEIIVVNDGSKDNSQNIIDDYASKDSRIISLIKKNGGQGSARNYGLKHAKGEFVTFVDSDDYVDFKMCEELYNNAKKNNSDLVFSDCMCVDENYNYLILDNNTNLEANNLKKKFLISQFGPCFKLIKLDILKKNKLFFPNIRAYEDISIVPAWILFSNNISYLDKKLYYYFIRQGSTMKQIVYNKKLEDIFISLELLFDSFLKNDKLETYNSELEWIYIENLLHAASLRFFKFDNYKKNLDKIIKIMKEKFPKWYKNKYYKKQSIKYKIICTLFYLKKYKLLKLLINE